MERKQLDQTVASLLSDGGGTLTQIITKGGSIKVPVETVLTFQLDNPL